MIARSASIGAVLLVCALLLPLPAQDAAGSAGGRATSDDGSRYYRSNADYIALDEIDPPEDIAATRGWVLAERAPPGARGALERTLYRDGTSVGREVERRRADGQPATVERTTPAGSVIFRERYAYRSDGTLRGVERCDDSGGCTTVRYGRIPGPGEELIRSGDLDLVLRYDDRSRPVSVTRLQPDGSREEESFRYEGGALVEWRRVSRSDEVVERYRDGLVVERLARSGGRQVEQTTYEYDDEGRVVREMIARPGTRIEVDYDYGPGAARTIERRVDGRLRLRDRRDEEGGRIVTRFLDGSPILREHFRDDVLILRETLRDGRVVAGETFGDTADSRVNGRSTPEESAP